MRPFGSNRQGMGQFVGHRLRFARVVGVLVPASRDRIRGKAVLANDRRGNVRFSALCQRRKSIAPPRVASFRGKKSPVRYRLQFPPFSSSSCVPRTRPSASQPEIGLR